MEVVVQQVSVFRLSGDRDWIWGLNRREVCRTPLRLVTCETGVMGLMTKKYRSVS